MAPCEQEAWKSHRFAIGGAGAQHSHAFGHLWGFLSFSWDFCRQGGCLLECLDKFHIEFWISLLEGTILIMTGFALSDHAPVSLHVFFDDFFGARRCVSTPALFSDCPLLE